MGIWSQARELAAETPEERNRYVDFLRAVSILAVITGHWLIAALYYHDRSLTPTSILVVQPATHWLTWLFQVMPILRILSLQCRQTVLYPFGTNSGPAKVIRFIL